MPELRLNSEVQYLKGVGPRRAAALARVGIKTVRDLLYYFPRRYIDRSQITAIGLVRANMEATIVGQVLGKGILKGRRSRLEVMVGDETGQIALIWFSGYQYLEKMFTKGDLLAVTGPVTYFQQNQMVHPEVERIEGEAEKLIHTGRIVPVYPSTADLKKAGLSGRIIRQMVIKALELTADKIEEFLPDKHRRRFGLPDLKEAIGDIHYPEQIEASERARKRLAFNELLELQYLILNNRQKGKEISKDRKCKKPQGTVVKFARELKFRLTPDQRAAVETIYGDMQGMKPMHRLLQGDVGCGKTVVAMLAAVYAAENDFQTAVMAPTEILAEQHYHGWRAALEGVGLRSELITGSMKKRERNKAVGDIANGYVDLIFGTHAVFSEDIEFKDLGLAVIDEQHRFGVRQRGKLVIKGRHPDVLVMTATPIPRTLALTLYGDLDITSIRTMPPGRQPVKTVWRTASARAEIYDYLKKRLKQGAQIFFIYPLVEKSEKLDLQAAEEEYVRLKKTVFTGSNVGLVHGQMKTDKRDKVIRLFRDRELDILVATTVVEVGIDIPSATIIVVEHAERFGLSQLHQLRGRVGRGQRRGMAIAVATAPVSELAKKRLNMFQGTTDGFKIAEADLQLRGPGEFFGTRQHGLPELKIANLATDTELLPVARDIVTHLLEKTGELDKEDDILRRYLMATGSEREMLIRYG